MVRAGSIPAARLKSKHNEHNPTKRNLIESIGTKPYAIGINKSKQDVSELMVRAGSIPASSPEATTQLNLTKSN